MLEDVRRWIGELLGTYGFVTIGAAAGVVAGQANSGLVGVALANGVALATMVTLFFSISGGHLNPAITFSAWLGRKIEHVSALGYVGAQLLGALGAGLTVRMIFPESSWRPATLGAPQVAGGVSAGRAVLIEAVFTFLLALAVWATGLDERGPRVGGFAIGLVVFVGVLAVGPLTGGAFNPARYFGPAVVAGSLHNWWVYFAGPAIGAGVAGLLYPTAFLGGLPWRQATVGPAAPGLAPPAAEAAEEGSGRAEGAPRTPSRSGRTEGRAPARKATRQGTRRAPGTRRTR